MNFKDIHIGHLIEKRVAEKEISLFRICRFMKCSEDKIYDTYISKDLPTNILLKWSKLLEYDFFRLYTQHLILYSPPSTTESKNQVPQKKAQLPVFRKNIYTKEIISFMMDLVKSGTKTKSEIIREYRIPKTTLYKWISKNSTEALTEQDR